MQITFNGFTQSLESYITGAAPDLPVQYVRDLVQRCEAGELTPQKLTEIVEGVARDDATFSE